MPEEKDTPKEDAEKKPAPEETSTTTQHSMQINGKELKYSVTAGTIVLKEEDEEEGSKAKASIFYVAYSLDGVKDSSKRPITFSFNGGPGSSSIWMHMGMLGPKRVLMDDDGMPYPPPNQLMHISNRYISF